MAYEDPFWKEQTTVPIIHAGAILAALFHYKMHAADLMCFLGGTYTGEHRDIDAIVVELNLYDIDPRLISQCVQAITVGRPNHFVAKTYFIGEKTNSFRPTKIWSIYSTP